MYKKLKLNNGMRVILNRMPEMESVAIGLWVNTGSRNEQKRVSGISHFLEHMVFKGTPNMTSRDIKELIEGKGGSLNGFTSEELTCYMAKVSGRHIETALDVLFEMVLHAGLKTRDIELEKTVIKEEIKMYRDLPNHHVHDILHELMWPGHPLGLSIAGSIESVGSIGKEDLFAYKTKQYTPVNMAAVLSGNFKEEAIIRRINNKFSKGPSGNPCGITEFINKQEEPRIRILRKETHQSHLSIGLHTFGRTHEDKYIQSLLHIILGANMSSRLFENIRDKNGLAYEIGTEIKRYKDAGAFIINAGTEHSKATETVRLALKELKKIRTVAVPKDELKRAKEFFKVQLLLTLEDTLNHMIWLGEHAVALDKLPDKNKIFKKIDSVTSHDLKRVAKAVFYTDNLNLALIGSISDRERKELEKILHL